MRLVGRAEVIMINIPLWGGWLGFGPTSMPCNFDYNCSSVSGEGG
jgi:hypothetical protein